MRNYYFFTSILLSICLLGSCKSEYHERLEKAKTLKAELTSMEADAPDSENWTKEKVQSIEQEIRFLAKVSGNEKLFFEEID